MSHLTYAEAIVTGIVQGVSELFPISSLGHNVLIPALLGGQWAKDLDVTATKSPYLAFIVGLHVATAFALIAYFWRDWLRIGRGFFTSIRDRRVAHPDQRLAWMVILGTIPVGLVGLLLQKVVTGVFAKPALTALFLAANGGVLLYSERQRRLRAAGPDGDWFGEDDRDFGRGDPRGSRGDYADAGYPDGGWDNDGRPRPRGPRPADDPWMGGYPDDRGGPPAPGFQPAQGQPAPGFQPPQEQPAPGFQPAQGQPGPGFQLPQGQPAPGFQPTPGQPAAPGFQPAPGQAGPGQAGPGHGHSDPAGEERTQVWNQQPGQQQWQGPDPRYNDPRYGQDPRYAQDPRNERDPRYAQDPRYGQDPRWGEDPRYAQEPPAAGQDPSFTPSFTPSAPASPPPGPAAPEFDPRFSPDPRNAEPRSADPRHADPRMADPRMADPRTADPRMADPRMGDPRAGDPRMADPRMADPGVADPRQGAAPGYPQDGPAPVGGAPSFTPAAQPSAQPGQGLGAGEARGSVRDERGVGQPPWEDRPATADPWDDFDRRGPRDEFDRPDRGPRRLPDDDEGGENVAADRRLATMSFKQAVFIAAWQIAALLPGISRDGIVTIGGMREGLRREDAVRFSFLLSAPVILAAGVLKLGELTGPETSGIMGPVLIGSALSFIGAYFSVRFLTRYFSESNSLKPFGYYCLALGSLAFVYLMVAG